eukprot:gene6407-6266_t
MLNIFLLAGGGTALGMILGAIATKLLQPLIGTSITYTNDQGEEVTAPRTVYTNINGLLLDHELIDGGENKGLRDWHKWAKPGSVIVFDEVQRHWKPRAKGSAVPPDIEALETHRHMGVDFIIITQNVLLVDRNIHALAGRHLHVRRIATMPMAIVYEWDHVSRALLYAKSLTKSPWRYSKKIFKLYKSAEVHTKQPRSIPGAVWFVLAASAPVFAGCMASRERCECFDNQGTKVEKDLGFCEVHTAPGKYLLAGGSLPDTPTLPPPPPPPTFLPPEPDDGITPAQLRAAYRGR